MEPQIYIGVAIQFAGGFTLDICDGWPEVTSWADEQLEYSDMVEIYRGEEDVNDVTLIEQRTRGLLIPMTTHNYAYEQARNYWDEMFWQL